MSIFGKVAYNILPDRYFAALRVLRDPRFSLAVEKVTYNQDRLLTSHNCDFMNDERFARAYKKGEETGSWETVNVHWRAFVTCWAADRAKNLEGDFVECGVNLGGLSRTVMEYIDFASMKNKKFYLLDTYEGLSEKYVSDEERKHGIGGAGSYAGGYVECYDTVKATFGIFENSIIIKGTVPDTLCQVKAEKVCYLSIDMNCAEPEIAAAEFFWDKLVSGAAIILDDYGWTEHMVQKLAFDDFAKRKNVPLLPLPTGQRLIIKP